MRATLPAAVLLLSLAACNVATPVPTATPGSSATATPAPSATPGGPSNRPSVTPSPTPGVPTEGATAPTGTASPAPTATPTAGEPTESPFLPLPASLALEPGPNDVSVTLSPSSLAGAEVGKVYAYTLDHCGLMSPFDFDGSFWTATGGVDSAGGPVDSDDETGELINAGSGRIVLINHDTLQYQTGDLESVIEMRRHEGDKAFFLCS